MPLSYENQMLFLNRLSVYLSIVAQERPTIYHSDDVLTRLKSLQQGHCSGITALWLYYKKRDKQTYFYDSIMSPILAWDGTKETLSKELEEAMEYALSVSVSLQGMNQAISGMTAYSETPFEQSSVQQSDYDVLFDLLKEDDYPDIRKEYEIAFVFTNDELKELLESFAPDKLIRLSSSNHAIGLFFDGQEYVLFDPNGFVQEGTQERFFEKRFAANQVEKLIENIQSVFMYAPGSNVTGLTISVFDDVEKPMPVYPDRVKRTREMLYKRAEHGGAIDIDAASAYDDASALYLCATQGHLDMVKLLLSRGAKVDKMSKIISAETSMGNTILVGPIHAASENGHLMVLEALLNSKVGKGLVNVPTGDGQTPLYLAAKNGHVDTIKLLLNRGATIDPMARIRTGVRDISANPIHIAAENGHEAALVVLLNSDIGKGLLNIRTRDGKTPLDLAIEHGHIETVKLLLSLGAAINIDVIGTAAACGRDVVLDLLLDSDAGRGLIDAPVVDDTTLLEMAVTNGFIGTVKLLLSRGAHVNSAAIYTASEYNRQAILELLLDAQIEPGLINVRNEDRRDEPTSLAIAVEEGHINIVTLLLNRRARVDKEAIHAASRNGNLPILNLLLDHLIDTEGIDAPSHRGHTALSMAVENSHSDVIELLLSKRATVDKGAIYAAAEKGDLPILNLLLDAVIDPEIIDAPSKYGQTALNIAARNDHIDSVKLLLNRGATVSENVIRSALTLKSSSNRSAMIALFKATLLKKKESAENAPLSTVSNSDIGSEHKANIPVPVLHIYPENSQKSAKGYFGNVIKLLKSIGKKEIQNTTESKGSVDIFVKEPQKPKPKK